MMTDANAMLSILIAYDCFALCLNQLTFQLYPLKGELKGFWVVTIRANWRVIFHFADGHTYDVDLIDYR